VCGCVAVFGFCELSEGPVRSRFWKKTEWLARSVKAVAACLSFFFRLSSLKRDSFIVSVLHTSGYFCSVCVTAMARTSKKAGKGGAAGPGVANRPGRKGKGTHIVPVVVLPVRPVRETKGPQKARLEAEAAATERAKAATKVAADPLGNATPHGAGSEDDDDLEA
jgi:hypothetical protein